MHWDLSEAVLDQAGDLIKRRGLRSLDSLQLASALHFGKYLLPGDSLLFITSDQRLLEAAAAEGLATWNPELSARP